MENCTGTVPLTVAPPAGLVIEIEGLSVSGRTDSELAPVDLPTWFTARTPKR